ncbi:MAG: hypothetical protein KatS3mg119_0037 [Rhodothalassiaceae bacterium]|nr:MAG: hypothetical protein KatS3mg119_0037 [Rhodothalassiaceae bacterium]
MPNGTPISGDARWPSAYVAAPADAVFFWEACRLEMCGRVTPRFDSSHRSLDEPAVAIAAPRRRVARATVARVT